MVYYRKYRPQTIEELDNQRVRETLAAVLHNSVPHAFLFTGPKGLGKTSTARIVAKAVNCENNSFAVNKKQNTTNKENKVLRSKVSALSSSIEPCNECDQCLSIMTGTNLDVIEIDAASNRGIDEIRELKEKVNLTPTQSRKKVYIIDEVHMLTTEAFNALLKTLEEPPTHAIFILCTTEQHKVPLTILSRCFHIAFHSATTEELVRSFKRIVHGEKLSITDDALIAIADMADGGFRDGTKLLEEIVALSGDQNITKELVEEKLHVTGIQTQVEALLSSLSLRDGKKGLAVVKELVTQKADIQFFLQQVLNALHELLLRNMGMRRAESKDTDEALKFTITEIEMLSGLLSEAYLATKQTFIPQFPLELAVVKWCTASSTNITPTTDVGVKRDNDTTVSVSMLRRKVGEIVKEKALYGETKAEIIEETPVSTTSVSLLHFSKDGKITKEWLDAFWRSLISEMKNYNHTIAGVLRSCRIETFDRKNLIIEAAYQFHKDKLSEAKTLGALEQVCKTLIGNPVFVTIKLKGKQ